MSTTATKPSTARRITKFLTEDGSRTITGPEICARFGVVNATATMSRVRDLVERHGNWRIVTGERKSGKTEYSIRRVALLSPNVDTEQVRDIESDSFFGVL